MKLSFSCIEAGDTLSSDLWISKWTRADQAKPVMFSWNDFLVSLVFALTVYVTANLKRCLELVFKFCPFRG